MKISHASDSRFGFLNIVLRIDLKNNLIFIRSSLKWSNCPKKNGQPLVLLSSTAYDFFFLLAPRSILYYHFGFPLWGWPSKFHHESV